MLNPIKRILRRWYWKLPRTESGDIQWMRYVRRLILKIVLWFFIISIGSTILFRFLPVPVTPLMLIRLMEQASASDRSMRLEKDWVSIDEISPHLQLAVVCSEDQEFLEHEGFDFKAIKKAYNYNQTHKKKRGASTISQQTAKNVFLWPGRSWLRKGLEVYFTFLIEVIWSKERIMEVYLNIIEFGDGVYGVEAAALRNYNKSAKDINRPEAAMLAAVLPSPLRLSPINPTGDLREKQSWIMRQMRRWGGQLDYEDPNTPKKK
jgi:monofunctional glycosyltransferase